MFGQTVTVASVALMLAFCISGCVVVPVLAIEATCQVASIALNESNPDLNAPLIEDHHGEGLVVDTDGEDSSIPAIAKKECAKNGAGPNTDCVDYMTQLQPQ